MKKKNNFLIAYIFGPVIYSSDTNARIVLTLKITEPAIINKIISGEIRGLSPEMIVRKWKCSICHDDFEKCPHEIGQVYDGVVCQAIAREIKFTGVSIVDHPQNHRCRITDLLIIRERNGRRIYDWYGFKVDTEDDRFRNIQRAFRKGLIPKKAALSFNKFFSIQIEGRASYP